MYLLGIVRRNLFFCVQVHAIHVLENHQIVLNMRYGPKRIEFGRLENVWEKLEKLKLFYSHIAPNKGWETYQRVNVAFDNQIICQ